jgi:hypothetical protein
MKNAPESFIGGRVFGGGVTRFMTQSGCIRLQCAGIAEILAGHKNLPLGTLKLSL